MQKFFVTGAAGFIGSSLADRLLADGKSVASSGSLVVHCRLVSNTNFSGWMSP